MENLQQLIIDLALILGAAGIITLLFKKLKQPLVLGYIIAGLLVSPNFKLFPTITDVSSVKVWADIGVIFLLFSLGLEFSFKKLVKVGGSAGITGIYEVSLMLLTGYITGRLLNWSTMDSIFLGGIIAISSTTIIIRAFDELGVKTKKFAGMVLGVLVIEDLAAVLLLVLLSTVAVSRQFSGEGMLFSVLKLAFFLILWFISGIFLLPTFLKRARRLMTEETMLVLSLGLCLLMVVLATRAGFSSALGAFIMGSILAETPEHEKIIALVKPVKDLFGAVFFVSVGMLINLSVLAHYIVPVLLLTAVVIVGKTVNATMGSLISGQALKQSLQTGMSLAQIGEFSFIIATLGLTLKVTSAFLYPIAVGVSVLTTFCSPYLIRYSEPFYNWIEKRLPASWITYLNRYSASTQKIGEVSSWRILLRAYIKTIIIHSVIIIGLLLIVLNYITPFLTHEIDNPFVVSELSTLISLLVIAPFLWALAFRRVEKISFSRLWMDKVYNRGPLVLIEILRIALGVLIIGFLLNRLFSVKVALAGASLLIVMTIILFRTRLQSFYTRMENRFLANLRGPAPEPQPDPLPNLVPWDGHITYLDIPPESSSAGKTLLELSWREKYGINVALIERGSHIINVPGRHERIYPGDHIGVIGTDEQLEELQKHIMPESPLDKPAPDEQMELVHLVVQKNSPLEGKNIRNSGIRYSAQGLVVGVERDGVRQLNPDSSFVFQENDVVWIAGNKKLIKQLAGGASLMPIIK
jgi:CPA2 family monovalent cation:H+ antiporter-2